MWCRPAADSRATENVILLMTDGLRWQEVFTGAEESLLTKEPGGVKDVEGLKAEFWRNTPEERRAVLLPFLWGTVGKQGQIFGNRNKGSHAQVTNGMHFSYPGYNETLCGFADPRIDSNDKVPNPNVTVFEWLNRQDAYHGKVAAFGVWDCFPYIFNRDRCGFLINAGFEPLPGGDKNPRIALLNELKTGTTAYFGAEPFDAFEIESAIEYIKDKQPRVFFLSLNETDAWGHGGRYDLYLKAAHAADDCLRTPVGNRPGDSAVSRKDLNPRDRRSRPRRCPGRLEEPRREDRQVGVHLGGGYRTRHARPRRARELRPDYAKSDRGDRGRAAGRRLLRGGAASGQTNRRRAAQVV